MSFAIHGRNLPRIRSFEDCEHHARRMKEDLTQRRIDAGWSDTNLPLYKFNDPTKRLVWRTSNDAPRWACVFHKTEVVSYFQDGRMMFDASYDSQSTNIFFDHLSPMGVLIDRCGRQGMAYVIGYGRDDAKYHRVDRNIVNDKGDEWNQGMVVSSEMVPEHPQDWPIRKTVANKEKRGEIKVRLKNFFEWYDCMTRVANGMGAVMAGGESGPNPGVEMLYEQPDNEGVWRGVCYWAARTTLVPNRWQHAQNNMEYGPAWIEPTRKHILAKLWNAYDGWMEVNSVVPAGEKP